MIAGDFEVKRTDLPKTLPLLVLLLIVFAILPLVALADSPKFIQEKDSMAATGTTNSIIFSNDNAQGNLIVVYVVWDNTGNATVSDSRGNAYFSAVGPTRWASNKYSAQIFYAKNIAAGSNSVTVKFSTAIKTFAKIYAHEYSGIDKNTPIDKTKSAIGTSKTMNSGNITTSNANDLLFGAGASNAAVTTSGAGYTIRSMDFNNMTEDKNVLAKGTYNVTGTQNGTAWTMQLVAFRAVTPPPADTQPPIISSFTIPSTSQSITVPVLTFNATDNVLVTGYLLTEIPAKPLATDNGWSASAPANYIFGSSGQKTLYAWAKDAAGNVSQSINRSVTITLPDTTPPSAPNNLAAIPVSQSQINLAWDASTDDTQVAGYQIYRDGNQVTTIQATTYNDTWRVPNTTYTYYVLAIDAAGNKSQQSNTATATTLLAPPVIGPAYPVKPSANGRYLVDQNNVPFMMIGDSPQALTAALSEDDAEYYFANRQAAGFNAAWVNLLCIKGGGCDSEANTYDGIPPFTTQNDLGTPNEAYFTRVDHMIQIAANHGITVVLDPIETISWLPALRSNGITKAREYGRYLGSRYKNFKNIIWMSGNDFQTWTNESDDELVQAVALGILDNDPNHIQTAELNYTVSSTIDDPTWIPIVNLNAAYTYYSTYGEVLKDYQRSNIPTFMVEANYEFENLAGPVTTAYILRKQEYWTMLSGATGQLYGNGYTWPFLSNWKSYLDTPGSSQIKYLNKLFLQYPWYDLVPDINNTAVTAGLGTYDPYAYDATNDYLTAARTSDGALVIAYLPTRRTITIDMSKLAGIVNANWYDPTNGQFTAVTGSPFSNSGTRQFTPNGNNGAGEADWVLVLEGQALFDTQSPTTPQFLSANNVTSSRIALIWEASTDNVSVAGYKIFRNGALIATTPFTAFQDTDLNAQTQYEYAVLAYDSSGNSSEPSSTITITTLPPDTTPPTTPTNLTATNITQTSAIITWGPSKDENGSVDGYLIYRNGIQAAIVSQPEYYDTALAPNMGYTYTVSAFDDSNNFSAQSQPLGITTLQAPPAVFAFIQQANAVPQSPQNTISLALSSTQAYGDTTIIAIGWNDITSTITSVADSLGNEYSIAVPTFRGNGISQAIYYDKNGRAGNNTITVKFNQPAIFIDIRVAEYSGLNQGNPFDAGKSASGSGTSLNSGTITTTTPKEMIFGAGITSSYISTPGSGFTSRVITNPDGDIIEDKTTTTIGNYGATASQPSGNWVMQVAGFRIA